MSTLALPLGLSKDYGYVILAACSTFVLSVLHSSHTGKYRKQAKIAYPNSYASAEQAAENPAAYQFNCAQRAQANFTENHTSLLATLMIAGLKYPLSAAVLGAIWTVGRYMYMVGYTNVSAGPNGKGRYRGAVYYIGQAGLLGLSIWTGVAMILEK